MFLEQNTTKRNRGFSSSKSIALAILLFLTASVSYAADLSFSPQIGSYEKGKTITVDIYVNNNVEAINAVSGTISFSTDTLSVRSLSKDASIIKLWAEEPSYSNIDGTVRFEGVILNPGFSGSRGKVLTVVFNAKNTGNAPLSFIKGAVLANDGNATNVLKTLGTAAYTVVVRNEAAPVTTPVEEPAYVSEVSNKPVIMSDTYPNENKWYSSRIANFSWNLPSDVIAVRTLYDSKPLTTPSRVYDPPIRSKSFVTDEDGVMYMHVQWKDSDGWGAVAHRKFQIDTVAPKNLTVSLPEGDNTTNSAPTVIVQATDELSGLDHVTFRADGGEETSYPVASSNTYKLPRLQSGSHTVVVSVYDKALNKTQTSLSLTTKELGAPLILYYTKQAEYGKEIVIRGTSYPGMTVEAGFTDEKKNQKIVSTRAKDDGTFMLAWQDSEPGVYEMSVRAVDSNGAASKWTNSLIIVVENIQLIRIGMFIMNWLSLVLIIILASALVIATLWYSFLQFNRFRRKIHRTLKEAEDTLKTNVQALRRDTEEFHSILLKAEKKRDLTKEEETILKKFKKRLDITENEIEKKLEQMG